ncbi:NEDD4-like E3 ubiquitin-protein ligase WWP2 [Rhypophila decipiens]
MTKSLLPAVALIISALIKPVISECRPISYTFCEPDRIVHYYDPDTGEICPNYDCGGGRAPPKTDKPGCPFYKGTELPRTEKSYLPCWTPSTAVTNTPTTIPSPTTDAQADETSTDSIQPILTTSLSIPGPGISSTVTFTPGSGTGTSSVPPGPGTTEAPSGSGPSAPPSLGTQSSSTTTTGTPSAGNSMKGSGYVFIAIIGAVMGAFI